MSKKERNTLTRIERENVNRIGKASQIRTKRLYVKSLEETRELIETVTEVHSTPPSVEEWAALNDLLECSSGVFTALASAKFTPTMIANFAAGNASDSHHYATT